MRKLILLFAVSTLLLAGCSSDEPASQPEDVDKPNVEEPTKPGEDEENKWETVNVISLSQAEKPVMESMNDFGYRLMVEYAKASKDGSFDVSPVSVSTYLSMIANATEGDTNDQILAALGATDIDALNSLNSKLMHYLPCEENGACLEINNRIWLSNKYTAPVSLTKTVKEGYNADIECVDFTLPTTVPAINKWVSDKTHGLIPGLLYGEWTNFVGLQQTSANTVYFKGEWAGKFDKNATTNSLFTAPTGKTQVDMMHKVVETYYAKVDGTQIVKLSYRGGANSIELYLPTEGTAVKDIALSLNPDLQTKLAANLSIYEVTLSLPRFKSGSEQIPLNGALQSMGITSLLETDFSPLGINKISPLQVMHQTSISVDEEGTELAAVTGGMVTTAPGPAEDEIETPKVKVDFDRPFMYIVRNRVTGAILMAGVVTNPKK